MDIRFLTFDKNMLQSKTVGSICEVLNKCCITNNKDKMIDGITYILTLRNDAMAKKINDIVKDRKKTTVNSKIRQLTRRINDGDSY